MITIIASIPTDTLGSCETDTEAQQRLADMIEKTYKTDLNDLGYDNVAVDVRFQGTVSGWSRINVEGAEDSQEEENILGALTDQNMIWERFCSSEAAAD